MIEISQDFSGGNIRVLKIDGNTVYLSNEDRGTEGGYFYWSFSAHGAQGQTVRFVFDHNERIGFYGAAVSHDNNNWHWQYDDGGHQGAEFIYSFSDDEDTVYFAHSMQYRAERIFDFIRKNSLKTDTLCVSKGGRNIPCFSIGNGSKHIVLTSRHHACEATGTYVLEGVLAALIENPIPDTTVFCVPMVDYDGVCTGDHGKCRQPHDHNRDYVVGENAVYPEVEAIRKYIDTHNVILGCDFHSPHHSGPAQGPGSESNKVFIMEKDCPENAEIIAFSELFENSILPGSMFYSHLDNVSSKNRVWLEKNVPNFCEYVMQKGTGITLETAYFGTGASKFSEERAILLGKSFKLAIEKYLERV